MELLESEMGGIVWGGFFVGEVRGGYVKFEKFLDIS